MSDSGHNFHDVKRLLKLKRHEAPPPGYFNNFSSQVISRIREGEARESMTLAARLAESMPWLAGIIHAFEGRPGVLGGLATSACLVIVFGMVVAQNDGPAVNSVLGAGNQPSQVFASSTPMTAVQAPAAAPLAESAMASSGITLSTNPVTSLQPVAMFGQPAGSQLFQPAGYVAAGN